MRKASTRESVLRQSLAFAVGHCAQLVASLGKRKKAALSRSLLEKTHRFLLGESLALDCLHVLNSLLLLFI